MILYYPTEKQFIHMINTLHFPVCVTLLTNVSNVINWSCMLNFCIGCPGVFVTDAEIICEEDVNVPFIYFHHYKNISSHSLHKQLLH